MKKQVFPLFTNPEGPLDFGACLPVSRLDRIADCSICLSGSPNAFVVIGEEADSDRRIARSNGVSVSPVVSEEEKGEGMEGSSDSGLSSIFIILSNSWSALLVLMEGSPDSDPFNICIISSNSRLRSASLVLIVLDRARRRLSAEDDRKLAARAAPAKMARRQIAMRPVRWRKPAKLKLIGVLELKSDIREARGSELTAARLPGGRAWLLRRGC